MVSAIEREFATLNIACVRSLPAAIDRFEYPVTLILIDAAMFADVGENADRIAQVHPSATLALMLRDARRAPAMREVMASPVLRGVVPMDLRLDLWLAVLRLMLSGGEYMPLSLMAQAAAASREAEQKPSKADADLMRQLTGREFEILSLVAQGHQNKIIAARLAVSECTVKIHLHHVISKLGARNRTQAAALFHQAVGRGAAATPRPAFN